jgi:hypothetical protein
MVNSSSRLGNETGSARIMWGRFPALLGFMQLAQAEPTMTDKIVAGMQKFAVCMNNMLLANYTGKYCARVEFGCPVGRPCRPFNSSAF